MLEYRLRETGDEIERFTTMEVSEPLGAVAVFHIPGAYEY